MHRTNKCLPQFYKLSSGLVGHKHKGTYFTRGISSTNRHESDSVMPLGIHDHHTHHKNLCALSSVKRIEPARHLYRIQERQHPRTSTSKNVNRFFRLPCVVKERKTNLCLCFRYLLSPQTRCRPGPDASLAPIRRSADCGFCIRICGAWSTHCILAGNYPDCRARRGQSVLAHAGTTASNRSTHLQSGHRCSRAPCRIGTPKDQGHSVHDICCLP